MSHNRGYQNETTGQIIAVKKKEFTDDYVVWLIPNESGKAEGKKISPDFISQARAKEYAYNWMVKNPTGAP
jgi:hypothetical protein